MTCRRTLQGIPFIVRSPSLYEISGETHASSWISLCTLSRSAEGGWHIDVLMKQRHSVHRGPFRTRDEAVALIAGQTRGVA